MDETARLKARVRELEAAIKKHRRQTGHNMCWENDEELWRVLGDKKKVDHTPPPWEEFMRRCAAYRASKDK
jgi:hypothetical protein